MFCQVFCASCSCCSVRGATWSSPLSFHPGGRVRFSFSSVRSQPGWSLPGRSPIIHLPEVNPCPTECPFSIPPPQNCFWVCSPPARTDFLRFGAFWRKHLAWLIVCARVCVCVAVWEILLCNMSDEWVEALLKTQVSGFKWIGSSWEMEKSSIGWLYRFVKNKYRLMETKLSLAY